MVFARATPHATVMTATSSTRLTRRSDLLGFVPYLLGFRPSESIVLIGLQRRRVAFAARADADWPMPEITRQFANAVTLQPGLDAVMLLGYGPAELVSSPTTEVARSLSGGGQELLDCLRVTGERYFCLLCEECTPAEGVVFDPAGGVGAAYAVYEGLTAQPDRQSLVRQVQPVGGPAQAAMTQATDRAEQRLAELVTGAGDPARALLRAGRTAIDEALRLARTGASLDDDQVAWLSILLLDLPCRDHAWLRCGGGAQWQLRFWLDLTRRCEPLLVAPIATLLAWCAWRSGDGVLAGIALERALGADPDYSLARLLMQALACGVPPESIGAWPGLPERRKVRRRGKTGR